MIFKVSDNIIIECKSEADRTAFHHKVQVIVDGVKGKSYRVQYFNRTWEAWQFQSAIMGLAERIGKGRDGDKELEAKIIEAVNKY